MGEPATTIYTAREIVTMDHAVPSAPAVAVRDGRVLAVGSLDECRSWGPHVVDDRFAECVLVPGFVENHAHALEGLVGIFPYAGYFPRLVPDGTTAPGSTSLEALVARLQTLEAELDDPDADLVVIGFDPIYFEGQPRLDRHHLDRVSTTRGIFLFHASAHLATVNTVLLERHGIDAGTPTPGVHRGPDGLPSGELQEMPAISLARSAVARLFRAVAGNPEVIRNMGRMAVLTGTTSVGDLAAQGIANPASQALWEQVTAEEGFPVRITQHHVPAALGGTADWEAAAEACAGLIERNTDMLRTTGMKIVGDGSIQGFTAKMAWPGYYRGDDHGMLLFVPDQLVDMMRPFHRRRINIHVHCNGGATIDAALDAIETLLVEYPWLDHRHTIQHCQLTTAAQYRRMARLGVGANVFANHLWFWGDQHFETTIGPERARRLEAAATALREGVALALHTDASVTPLGHLHSMWCAVNRLTPKGRVLGEPERISAAEALRAVTLGPAYQLHLDHLMGSIEVGKLADFAVLADNPLTVDPLAIRDIEVVGTVLGGRPQLAADIRAGS